MYKIVNDKRLATYTKAIFKETIHIYIYIYIYIYILKYLQIFCHYNDGILWFLDNHITILFGSLEALELLLKNFFINLYV